MKYHLVALLTLIGSFVHADTLPPPSGEIVLTVAGQIEHTNGNGIAAFDRDMLDALAQRTTTTTTPWMDGAHDFSGPLGAAILDAVGATGQTLNVIALNDYSAELPAQDLRDYAVIFATHIDGEQLSVRDKGPLFMIYPFDENPELFNEVYFGRSVWQITRIEVSG